MSAQRHGAKASFPEFFWIWSEERGWKVPDVHWRAVHWLENRSNLAVLRCFRGFGKSTLLAVYNAWRYYDDPSYRILHQGDQDKTAYKTSRDTRSVLQRHPLTKDLPELQIRGEQSFWWASGNLDERNPSMQAAGITSNITSSRCEEAQNDDVEVPRNIQNPEAREKMRYRLGEQTHCMVPGARQLFVGTPHTHDSLYDEMEALGADCLTIKMFAQEYRLEQARDRVVKLSFVPEMIFAGIGKATKLLRPDIDYRLSGTTVQFSHAPGVLVDFYAESAWPERFTPDEMHDRRKKCRTINEWDSQYQLRSRPLHQVRLDPERIQAYDCEPRFVRMNKKLTCWLGNVQIVGMSLRWDPSSGKTDSDVSGAVLDLQDATGRHYWHRVLALDGDIAETSDDGKTVVSGQVMQLVDLIEKFKVPRVVIETNGIGGFAPKFLHMALKQRRVKCGVGEETAVLNKQRRILEALEPIITSGMLWAHVSVLEGPLWNQMRDWNPAVKDQPDDLLDAGAGAVTDQPARVGQMSGNLEAVRGEDWRQSAGVYEATLDA